MQCHTSVVLWNLSPVIIVNQESVGCCSPHYRQPAATGCVPATHGEITQGREQLGTRFWRPLHVFVSRRSHGRVCLSEAEQGISSSQSRKARTAPKTCSGKTLPVSCIVEVCVQNKVGFTPRRLGLCLFRKSSEGGSGHRGRGLQCWDENNVYRQSLNTEQEHL